jgi:tryptophan 2,3-dioxygenase
MKNTPYNLYIHFDVLNAIFIEDNSRLENMLKCGLTSIELSTKILKNSLEPTKIPNTNKIIQILKGLETQLSILKQFVGPIEGSYIGKESSRDSHSINVENLKLLDKNYIQDIDRITVLYFEITKKVTVNLGLEDQLNDIRTHFGLSRIKVDCLETLDYVSFVNLPELLKLNKDNYYNSEDELFMVVHQISECWFNIGFNVLISIHEQFKSEDVNFTESENHFKAIYEVLQFVSHHVLLLEHMILADYHPLRVALRGASGGQSHQAYMLVYLAKDIFKAFLNLLEEKKIGISDVLESPNTNVDLLSTIKHFERLERSLKNFFFQHFSLSSSIIGSRSFGSIGHEVVTLADKFVEPIFKEIDDAKYELALKTNFQYGESGGVLILDKEAPCPVPNVNLLTDHKVVHKVVNGYFEFISKLDLDQWVQLFSEEGYIEDPVGSRPYIGHKELAIFFKGVLRMFSKLCMTIERITINDYFVEVSWEAEATSYNNKQINFNGIEVFQISKEGKITVAQVYWSPESVANQL